MAPGNPRAAFGKIQFQFAVTVLKHYRFPIRTAIHFIRLTPRLAVVRTATHFNPLIISPLPERISTCSSERCEHQHISVREHLAEAVRIKPGSLLSTGIHDATGCKQFALRSPMDKILTGSPIHGRAISSRIRIMSCKDI